ncbi:MAG: O-antigen ligase family protein [Candidatus Promineifilaceae bacterium]
MGQTETMPTFSPTRRSINFLDFGASWPGPLALLAALAIGILFAAAPLTIALPIFAATAVFLLALIQPLAALALALIAGPFGALENVILGGLSVDSGQLLLLLALAAWIARLLINRRIDLPRTPLKLPILLFLAVAALSLLAAPDLLLGLKEIIKWLEIAAVMLMVTDLGSKIGSNKAGDGQAAPLPGIGWVLIMLFVAGLSQAVIGIWQFMFRGEGPEHFLVLGRFYRAYGTFEQPNPFGGFMNLTALLALGVLIGLLMFWLQGRVRLRPPKGRDRRLTFMCLLLAFAAAAVVAAATLLGLLFSWSRGAWMGFLAGLTIMVVFWPRRLRYGVLLLLLASVGFLFLYQSHLLPATVADRVSGFAADLTFGDVRGVDINDENYAVLERLAHWQAALDMAGDRPYLGIGFGNYGAAYGDYRLLNWPDALGHAHNYYLNTLAETGVLGLIAYVLLWSAIFWQTFRVLKREDWPLRGIALGLLGVWTAITIHHAVDKLYVNNIYIHLGVLLGLLQLSDLHTRSDVPERLVKSERIA